MIMASPDPSFPFLEEDRRFLRTLAQLARLDPHLRVREDESDIVQITLTKAFHQYGMETLAQLNPPQRRALLRTILKNTTVDLIRFYHTQGHDIDREQSARASVEESTVDWEKNVALQDLSPVETLAREERFARLAIAVQSLPDKERLVIQNKFFLNYSLTEVASRVDMTRAQVTGYYTRALKRLRTLLSDMESHA
jgi:RNA polymerase sigma-70 factor (subfamily 1)